MNYTQFKNEVLALIYGKLPSYVCFDDCNFQADLEDGYWHAWSEDDATKILIYFSKKYLNSDITEVDIKREEWDVHDVLIDLLIDNF